MSKLRRSLLQAAAGAGGVDTGDDDFANVVLLLDGDGTSDDNNNTFTDSSTNGFTVTETGSVVQGSFSPYGDNWSNYFDGSDRFITSGSSDFAFGTGDLSIDLWVNLETFTNAGLIGTQTNDTSASAGMWYLVFDGNTTLRFGRHGSPQYVDATVSASTNTWHHVHVSRVSSTVRIFFDGVSASLSNTGGGVDTYDFNSNGTSLTYGSVASGTTKYTSGYISNLRVIKGTSAENKTSNFTPPTSPLTAVTNTVLLLGQSNRFVDNSSSAHSFTVTGTPKVTPFSPFKNDDARDITTDGGSAYFDSNEYLTIADDANLDVSGAMTAECWVYITDMPDNNIGSTGQGYLINRWTASGNQRSWAFLYGNNGNIAFYSSSNGGGTYAISTATGALSTYRWIHVAASWDGTNQRLFIDGDLKVTTANASGPFSTPNSGFTVNAINTSLTGTNNSQYIADARYFPDKAIYTASFTPPTAPITAAGGSAYSLSGASYESKSFSILTQNPAVKGVEISTDGTKAYTVDQTNDAVYEYDLSTAFDISTASYNSVSFSVASQELTPREVRFKSDGTRMFVVGDTNDTVYQYDLSTAWDISSASYNSVSFSVSSEESVPNGMCFSADGTYMYISGQNGDDINQYSLTSAWDVSTASFDNKTFSVASEETQPESISISSDGTQMFMLGQATDKVHQYTLSTAYDISTASLTTSFTPAATNPTGIAFKADGTKFYIVGPVDDEIKQYSVFSDAAVLLSFQDAGIYDRSGINNLDTVGDARLGFAPIYGTGSLEFDGTGDYLKIPQNDGLELGSGDYTIECWVNISAAASVGGIFSKGPPSTLNTSTWSLEFNTTNNYVSWYVQAASTSYIITGSQNIKTSNWIHIAVTRSGNDTKLFVNGVQDGSTYTGGYTIATGGDLYLGTGFYAPTTRTITGFIDDFRITKGVARYTSDFTPPDEIDLSTDTHREYVTLFLDGDGTANGQNNTFTDSSTNDFTVTENGSVVQGVFSPYSDNWSLYFADTETMNTATTSVFNTGTSTDFTVEVFFLSDGGYTPALYDTFMGQWPSGGSAVGKWIFGMDSSGYAMFMTGEYSTSARFLTGTTDITDGKWHHIAVTRNGSVYRLFVDGTQEATATNSGYNVGINSTQLWFNGYAGGTTKNPVGYSSNYRFVSGTALYTSSFTPPTSPLTAVTGTQLLFGGTNRFQDKSSNDLAISIGNGTPKVTRFSPFESNKPYDITTDGGSGSFDGSSHLSVADSTDFDFGTGDFTMEAWVYPRAFTGNYNQNNIISVHEGTDNTAYSFAVYSDGKLQLYGGGGNNDFSTSTVSLNEWNHVMVTRSSGTVRFFINGTLDASTYTRTGNYNCTSQGLAIGKQPIDNGGAGATRYWNGWLANVRMVKGTALQTSSFTPPTAPLTAVTNTVLLLNFQDSAIPDLSGLNNIDTVGNAKVGASDPTKYGSNAMQFDGTGDYIQPVVAASELALGTGDFTIEFWMYPTSVDATIRAVLSNRYDGASNNVFACAFDNGTGTYGFGIYFHTQATGVMSTGVSPTVNTWQHLAFVRSNGTLYIYKDGTSIGTPTSFTSDLSYTVPPLIGKDGVRTGGGTASNFVGYLDDLRITKGIARYTSNFTPPTEALPKF